MKFIYYLYVYFSHGRVVYVGKTNDLLRRDWEHRRDHAWRQRCDELRFVNLKFENIASIYEGLLIERYYPNGIENKDRPGKDVEYDEIDNEYIDGQKWASCNTEDINSLNYRDDYFKYAVRNAENDAISEMALNSYDRYNNRQ